LCFASGDENEGGHDRLTAGINYFFSP
jgi:hypothetical protein